MSKASDSRPFVYAVDKDACMQSVKAGILPQPPQFIAIARMFAGTPAEKERNQAGIAAFGEEYKINPVIIKTIQKQYPTIGTAVLCAKEHSIKGAIVPKGTYVDPEFLRTLPDNFAKEYEKFYNIISDSIKELDKLSLPGKKLLTTEDHETLKKIQTNLAQATFEQFDKGKDGLFTKDMKNQKKDFYELIFNPHNPVELDPKFKELLVQRLSSKALGQSNDRAEQEATERNMYYQKNTSLTAQGMENKTPEEKEAMYKKAVELVNQATAAKIMQGTHTTTPFATKPPLGRGE